MCIRDRIICKAGTKAIRLDPAELPCLVQIHRIEWRGKALTRAQLCLLYTSEIRIINVDALTYAGNLENLKDIENRDNYTFVKANICDKEAIAKILSLIHILPGLEN